MSQRYRSDQDRIDEMTMKINNPHVLVQGSGFIAFPPQKRYEKPLLVQPPTMSHLEYPDEWKGVAPGGGSQPPRPGPPPSSAPQQYRTPTNTQGPPHQHGARPAPAQNGGAPQPRQYQAPHASAHHGATAAAAAAAATAAVAPQMRQQQSQYRAPVPPQAQGRPAQSAPTPAPAAYARAPITAIPTPSVRPVPGPVQPMAKLSTNDDDDDDDEPGGLTKAQKKRLRKKLREGAK